MPFLTRFRLTWDQSVSQFAEELPWSVIGILIFIGTCIVVWGIIWIGSWALGKPITKKWTRDSESYKKRTRRCGRSAGRLIIIVLAVGVGIIGFWIAASTAGVSFFSIVLSYGILGIVLTYSFGSGLQSSGAYFLIALTDKLSEDWYIEIIGTGIEGFVNTIGIIWVELEHLSPVTKELQIIHVPTLMIISSPLRRLFEKEKEYLNYRDEGKLQPNPNGTSHTGLRAFGLRTPLSSLKPV
jgi:hypothetical protein